MSSRSTPTPFISPLQPLNCVGPAYEIVGTDLYIINIGRGLFNLLKGLLDFLTGIGSPPVNALGYHPVHNYLYGISYTVSPQAIIRIGADAAFEAVGTTAVIPSTLTSQPLLIGDIDLNQQYWLGYSGGAGWIQVDMNAASQTYAQVVASGASANFNDRLQVGDWAAIPLPAYENRLYALAQEIISDISGLITSYNTHLVYFDTINHAWVDVHTFFNTPGGLLGQAEWGAVYTANDGNIYGTESNTGQTWRFSLTPSVTSVASLVTIGTIPLLGAQIDGARCALNNDLTAG